MSNLTNVQCQHGAGKHRGTEKLYKASAEVNTGVHTTISGYYRISVSVSGFGFKSEQH